MTRGRLPAALAVVATAIAVPAASRAQSAPQMQVGADLDTVGVGDVVHLELSAQSTDGMPSDPRPGATPGFVVRGPPATSPSRMEMNINGAHSSRFGLTVDWTLQAQRVGTFSVGPPTVALGGSRYSGRAITIRVVPANQAPQRSPPQQTFPQMPQMPFGFSPFDPWKGIPGIPSRGDHDDTDTGPPPVSTDAKLALDAPRAPYYFLHATVDKTAAVVGEQVTFSVYEYLDREDARLVEIDGSDAHEPTAADFVKRVLLPEDKEVPFLGYASIGEHTWRVTLIRRWALFPLHTGDLTIDPMTVTLARPRSQNNLRTSETLHVHVVEPPAAGRPPGYRLGDVGRFALAAQVTPRDLEQGSAVGVHVELSGTGNLPASIDPPARDGVEWLTPEVHEQLTPTGRDTASFGGKRTFDYVVRVRRAGDVDLGELRLPYWDPDARKYDVARAAAGVVHVKASSAAPVASGADDHEALAALPAVRDALEGTNVARAHPDDTASFWLLGVGAWPAALGVVVAGRATGKRLAGRWQRRRTSPATELRERMASAEAACRGDDARAADAAIARAIEAATVAHAGVGVRGAVGGEVVDRLERAGVARATAEQAAELLRACEAARFSPTDADVAAARARWSRARDVLKKLEASSAGRRRATHAPLEEQA